MGSADKAASLQFQTVSDPFQTSLAYPLLLCNTKYYSVLVYYSSTTLYSKLPLLCTSPELQSSTPVLQSACLVLLCTSQYYKLLLHCYSVVQSTTPYYYKVLQCYSSTTPFYKVLFRTRKHYYIQCESKYLSTYL